MTNPRDIPRVPYRKIANSCNLSAIDGIPCKNLGSRTIRFFFLPKQEAGCGECRGSRDLKLSKSTAFMMHVSDGRDRRKTYAEVFIGILGKIGGTIN